MKEEITNGYLHDWVFHYNPFMDIWSAVPRDLYVEYWNGYEGRNILRAKHLNVLIDLLHKAKGDVETIHEITRSSDIL